MTKKLTQATVYLKCYLKSHLNKVVETNFTSWLYVNGQITRKVEAADVLGVINLNKRLHLNKGHSLQCFEGTLLEDSVLTFKFFMS